MVEGLREQGMEVDAEAELEGQAGEGKWVEGLPFPCFLVPWCEERGGRVD